MTILPKKKSSSGSKGTEHLHRDTSSAQNPDYQLPHSSGQSSSSSTSSGWGPGVPSGSTSGWSPPSGSGGTASQRWSSSGSVSPGSPDFVVESAGTKRPNPAGPYVEEAAGGPSASKRRLCERPGVSSSNAAAQNVAADSSVVVQHGPVLSPTGPMSPTARSASPPQPGPSGNCGEGYNSEDEYSHLGVNLTEEEWQEKDRKFERAMKKKGFLITKMVEDGSCLFRAVADQIYGDQEMHHCVRRNCMDYIEQNADYYSQYVTEDIADYVERKRYLGVHGNHLEIQALSEMYNRPIHIYCYSTEPINIFQGMMNSGPDSHHNPPIRLCYHRGVHYNSIVDPHEATIGVGLGLPGMIPGAADRNLLSQAYRANEDMLVERAMLEDKIKATDWEATNEAIEEQVARESYLQWLRDNERRNKSQMERSSTVTSGELRAEALRSELRSRSPKANSPKPGCSSNMHQASSNSPKAGCSFYKDRDSPKPQEGSSSHHRRSTGSELDYGLGSDFRLIETASFLNGLPPNMFGLEDWTDADVLTQVIAASQQEYLDSLKKKQQHKNETSEPTAAGQSSGEPRSNQEGSSSSAEAASDEQQQPETSDKESKNEKS